jgi:hypothetical protein
MPKLSSAQSVRYYAPLGAEAKVREVKVQIAEILAVFPDIAVTHALDRGTTRLLTPLSRRRKRLSTALG